MAVSSPSLAVISRSVASPAERIPGIQLSAATPPITQRHRGHGNNGAISAVRSGSRVRWSPRRQSVYMLEFAGLLAGLPLMPKWVFHRTHIYALPGIFTHGLLDLIRDHRVAFSTIFKRIRWFQRHVGFSYRTAKGEPRRLREQQQGGVAVCRMLPFTDCVLRRRRTAAGRTRRSGIRRCPAQCAARRPGRCRPSRRCAGPASQCERVKKPPRNTFPSKKRDQARQPSKVTYKIKISRKVPLPAQTP